MAYADEFERLVQYHNRLVNLNPTAGRVKLQPLPNPPTVARDDALMEVPPDPRAARSLLPNALVALRNTGSVNIEYAPIRGNAIISYVTMAVHVQWLKHAPERLIEISTLIARSARGNALYDLRYDRIFPDRIGWYNRNGQNPRFLAYTCPSTGRLYASLVPRRLDRAKNSNDPDAMMAWKFSLTPEEYANLTAEA